MNAGHYTDQGWSNPPHAQTDPRIYQIRYGPFSNRPNFGTDFVVMAKSNRSLQAVLKFLTLDLFDCRLFTLRNHTRWKH